MAKQSLNAQDERRLTALQDIRQKLLEGKHVQNRRLASWLLPDEYESLSTTWAEEQQHRLDPADKPSVVVEYERRLKRAHFVRNKAESASAKGKRNASKLSQDADSAYEDALAFLIEYVDDDPSLQLWFDRPLNWSPDGTVGTEYERMPRVITSRSRENQSDGSINGVKQSKRDIKIAVVERAIDALKHPPPEQTDADNAQLKAMLNAFKSH